MLTCISNTSELGPIRIGANACSTQGYDLKLLGNSRLIKMGLNFVFPERGPYWNLTREPRISSVKIWTSLEKDQILTTTGIWSFITIRQMRVGSQTVHPKEILILSFIYLLPQMVYNKFALRYSLPTTDLTLSSNTKILFKYRFRFNKSILNKESTFHIISHFK